MLVLRTGVAELHYLDEDGTVVGDPVDVFMVQDQIPTAPEDVKIFFQKDAITKKQASFYCLLCQTYINNLYGMKDHCAGRKHKNNLGKLEQSDKLEYDGLVPSTSISRLDTPSPSTIEPSTSSLPSSKPLEINPYHQAWAGTAEDCLTLVSGPGVAEFRVENKTVDAYDFQQVHKFIPFGFFRKSSSGFNNSFHCIVCDISLTDPIQIKIHCAGREHLKNGMDYSRRKLGVVPAKVKDVPAFQSLVSVMQSAKEPCIGLEHLEEWWESSGNEPPIYTCKLCEVWGPSAVIYAHTINETHRRKQLIFRFPVLAKMISAMDRIELLERAKEEEDKHGGWENRNYKDIKNRTDDIKYAALKRMSSGSCNPVGNPFSSEELEDEVADLAQAKRSSEHIHSTSEVGLGNPGPWEDRGPRGRGFSDRGRGGFVDRGRGFGDRGRWFGNRGRGFGRGDFGPTGWRGGHPREVLRHPETGFSRGGRGFVRGGAGHISGTGEGPLYGRKMNGEFEKYNEDTRIPSLQDRDMFVQDNFRHRNTNDEAEEDPPDAYYAVSADQEDYGYGNRKEEPENRLKGVKKSDRLDIQIEQNSYSEGDPHQRDDFRSGDRSEFRSDFRSDFRGGFRGGFRGDFSYGDSRYSGSYSNRNIEVRMRKHYADRYYGPEEGDSQYIRKQRVDSGSFGRDYILHRGKRPDRYFGPESGIKEKRFRAVHDGDDQPYQGPTIFDKVFRQHSRKSSTDEPVSVSRSVSPEIRKRKFPRSPDDEGKSKYKSRRMSPDSDEDKAKEELEAEWLKYKEKTAAKIRREKKKLMKYEERINHLENLTQNEQIRLKPLDIEKYERRKRKLESSRKRSKSRGRDSSYEPDPVISRSPPCRYRGTPPPGADLRPVLIEGDGEYISEDEYDSNYSDYKPAGRIHDAYKNY